MTDTVSRPPGLGGLAAGAMAKIEFGFGEAARAHHGRDAHDLAQMVFQIPVVFPVLPIAAGAGSTYLDGPQAGDYWSLRRLSLTGFTAGTVILYRNPSLTNINGTGTLIGFPEQLVPYPLAATNTFGRGEALLNPNDTMALVATGVTLTAGFPCVLAQGSADRVPAYLLPEYLN